jgi:lactose/L-arabinose transport system substrate-binding protein
MLKTRVSTLFLLNQRTFVSLLTKFLRRLKMTIQGENPKLLESLMCFVVLIFFSTGAYAQTTPDPSLEATLEIWGWDGAFGGLKAVDEKFLELYPNITLNYVPRPTPDTNQQILLSATAGSGFPDISVVQDHYVKRYAEFGILADITDFLAPYRDSFPSYKLDLTAVNDRLYAVPWDGVPVAVFYRRDVFEAAGVDAASIETWEDYLQAGETILEATGVPMLYMEKAQFGGSLFSAMVRQQGIGILAEDGSVLLDKDPRHVEVLNYIARLWETGVAAEVDLWSDAGQRDAASGKVATIIEEVWMGGILSAQMAPEASGQWGVFQLPAWEAGGGRAVGAGGSYLAVFEASENKEAALAYLEFHVLNTENQLEVFKAADIFPSLTTTYESPFFQEGVPYFADQPVRALFAEVNAAIPTTGSAEIFDSTYGEMMDLLVPELQSFAVGQKTAEEALATAAQLIRERTGRD